MNIPQLIESMLRGRTESLRIQTGEVTARHDGVCTVTVKPANGPELLGVRLRAVQTDNTGLVGYPKIGSYVAVALLDAAGTEALVVLASEIEFAELFFADGYRLRLNEDGSVEFVHPDNYDGETGGNWAHDVDGTADFTAGGNMTLASGGTLALNSGTYGGMTKLTPLVAELSKLNANVFAIKTALSAWVPVPGDGGTALKTLLTAALPPLPNAVFNVADFENPDVTHGPK